MRAALTHPAEAPPQAAAAPGSRRAWAIAADNALGHLVEIPAAILVVAEIVILFSGIVARYVLHTPLVWSDELASILFLWLAMLGAVIAFRRGEHMRMGALVNRASPATRALLDMVAVAAALAFLLLLQAPGYEYASEEQYVTTAALEIPNIWRAAALPVGTALMLLIALLRLVERAQWRVTGLALLLVGGVVAATVFAGVPIAFAFGLATFGYLSLTTDVPMMVVVGRMDEGMSHLILLAVPLFVFLGVLIEMTGMAKRMVAFLASLLGHVRGGLSYVLIGAMYVVSGISGAKAADMAAVAPVLFPEMRERGADEGDLVALLSATGAQTETVPPSLVLITIGSVTGVSITALFTGGLLPGLVLGVMLCLVVWWRNRREDLSAVRKASGRQIGRALLVALPALALPFVIRAAVVEGVATATEVSTIGIVYATLIGLLVYRCFDAKRLKPMLVDTACLSGSILLIIGTATAMAWALTQSGFSTQLAQAMAGLPGGAATFMAVSIVAFVILGSVLEGIPAIVLFGPLLFPIAHQMGIHEVHYAMVVILSMGLGLFAPPFGVGYYAACAIGRVAPEAGIRPILGYLGSMAVGIVVIAAVPWISTGFLK